MTVFIYALRCPESQEIRYVGKSVSPHKRLKSHISSAERLKYNHHTSRWIRKLLSSGMRPILEILEEVAEGKCWREVERRWIASAIENGWPITNSTLGGEGLDYIRDEDKKRCRSNLSASLKAYYATEDGRDKLERFMLAGRAESAVKKRLEGIYRSSKRPEFISKMKSVNSEINSRQSVKDKKSVSSSDSWKDPSVREKRMKGLSSRHVKKVQSEKRKAAWADPVLGAKLREIHNSPKVRAKKSESAKNRATPEYRAMMAEKTRLAWVERRKSANKE